MELLAEARLEPGLDAEGLVPRDALEEGIDEADQQEGRRQLRLEARALGDAARDDRGIAAAKVKRKKKRVSSKPWCSTSAPAPEKKCTP